jgi:tetratricopeptide (TPR) repeat protein
MEKSSSVGQNQSVRSAKPLKNSSTRTSESAHLKHSPTRVSKSASSRQKCWQPKPKRSAYSHYQGPTVLSLSSAEQETILRQRALAEAHHGNHGEALLIFDELIARNPHNANYYSNRGLVHFQDGQLNAAVADYNRAIELNPRLDSAYNNRANYYAAQGMFLEAILDYDIALDLNPTNIRAWINQGITFRELELYDRALESFDLALCLGKLEGHIYAERGRTYHLRGDWNCAIGDYRQALNALAQPSTNFESVTLRLYLQVESWMDELLRPLQAS